jgi:hypothetical protein
MADRSSPLLVLKHPPAVGTYVVSTLGQVGSFTFHIVEHFKRIIFFVEIKISNPIYYRYKYCTYGFRFS